MAKDKDEVRCPLSVDLKKGCFGSLFFIFNFIFAIK